MLGAAGTAPARSRLTPEHGDNSVLRAIIEVSPCIALVSPDAPAPRTTEPSVPSAKKIRLPRTAEPSLPAFLQKRQDHAAITATVEEWMRGLGGRWTQRLVRPGHRSTLELMNLYNVPRRDEYGEDRNTTTGYFDKSCVHPQFIVSFPKGSEIPDLADYLETQQDAGNR